MRKYDQGLTSSSTRRAGDQDHPAADIQAQHRFGYQPQTTWFPTPVIGVPMDPQALFYQRLHGQAGTRAMLQPSSGAAARLRVVQLLATASRVRFAVHIWLRWPYRS